MSNLENLGTLGTKGITETKIKSAVKSSPLPEIKHIEGIDSGVNVSAKVTLTTGDEVFVKVGTFSSGEEGFKIEPFVLNYLFKNTTVPVPEPLYYDYTANVLKYPWHISQFVPGETKRPGKRKTSKIKTIGHILGQINSVSPPVAGSPVFPRNKKTKGPFKNDSNLEVFSGDGWKKAFMGYTNYTINTIEKRFRDLKPTLRDFFKEHEEYIPTNTPPSLLHLDYWWENFLWETNETVVVDWQQSYSGDPYANLAVAEYLLVDSPDWGTKSQRVLRDSYLTSLSNTRNISKTTWRLYELHSLLRELRGFPYWWRNESPSIKKEREEQLRKNLKQILDGDTLTPVPAQGKT